MNILHLSDIHFGRNNPEYHLQDCFANHDKILSDLISVLQDLGEDKKPEHIVVTGDVAWHGKEEEFQEAKVWFDKLLSALHLTGKDITFCVGNHDVNWDFCPVKEIDDDSLKAIDELYKYENIYQMELSIYHYDRFCDSLGVIPYTYPVNGYRGDSYSVGFKDIQGKDGKKIRLISFNTSLLFSQPNISEDKMWLGQEQLKSLMEYGVIPAPEDVWYTIVLFHHSDRFLSPYETSSYEGRLATLPMLMENADLLLCGHTESIGKPRRLRQAGGGTMLCAGATYYSDTHNNIVSILSIADQKKSLGFTPVVYDGEKWTKEKLTYFLADSVAEKSKLFKREGKIYTDCTLEFYAGEEKKTISMKNLEVVRYQKNHQKYIRIDDRTPMNYFSIGYDGPLDGSTYLYFKNSPIWTDFVDSVLVYLNAKAFFDTHAEEENCGWRIKNGRGTVLVAGKGFPSTEAYRFSKKLLLRLKTLEDHYHVRFYLPPTIEKEDEHKIQLLEDFMQNGCYDHTKVENVTFSYFLEEHNLEEARALVRNQGPFYLKGKDSYEVMLFGATIRLGYLRFLSGPYTMDYADLEQKVSTFASGDQRILRITNTETTQTRFYLSSDKYQKESGLHNLTLEDHCITIAL